jgi:hypothetical protein
LASLKLKLNSSAGPTSAAVAAASASGSATAPSSAARATSWLRLLLNAGAKGRTRLLLHGASLAAALLFVDSSDILQTLLSSLKHLQKQCQRIKAYQRMLTS